MTEVEQVEQKATIFTDDLVAMTNQHELGRKCWPSAAKNIGNIGVVLEIEYDVEYKQNHYRVRFDPYLGQSPDVNEWWMFESEVIPLKFKVGDIALMRLNIHDPEEPPVKVEIFGVSDGSHSMEYDIRISGEVELFGLPAVFLRPYNLVGREDGKQETTVASTESESASDATG